MKTTPKHSVPSARPAAGKTSGILRPVLPLLLFLWYSTAAQESIGLPIQNFSLFAENRGQIVDTDGSPRPDIRYAADIEGHTVYLISDRISFVATKATACDLLPNGKRERVLGRNSTESSLPAVHEWYRIDMQFLGCNPRSVISHEGSAASYNNYYLAHCPEGILHVPVVNTVRYSEIYPYIDLLVYVLHGRLKYDFVVKPGGEPGDIRLKIIGADTCSLTAGGVMTARHPLGTIAKNSPYTYQNRNGDTVEIVSRYNLDGDLLTFSVSSYNRSMDLVIDPVVRMWGTYFGGDGADNGTALAVDRNGDIVLTGNTSSLTAIATPGAHQSTYGGGGDYGDAYIAKFDPAGRRLWATYFGGSENDYIRNVAIDPSGNIVGVGTTLSANGLATPGAHQMAGSGGWDGLIVKLNTNGVRLWSTYYGGPDTDILNDVDCDEQGVVYIGGHSNSRSGIATAGAHQGTMRGSGDAVIAKFNATGSRIWETYYGGTAPDELYSIAYGNGRIYTGGATYSATGIASPGAHQSTLLGERNGCVLCLTIDGVRLWGGVVPIWWRVG